MPDAPFATTLSLAMGKWAQGKNPGASALNANWDKIDAAALIHGTVLPTTYQVGKMFLKDDDNVIFRNDGTLSVPIWTAILDVGTVAAGLAAKAPQSQVDTIQTAVNELETDVMDLEAADFVKRDGSLALTGDLDFGTHKAKGVAPGVNPDEGVNVGQLDAAIAAATGLLGTQIKALVTRASDQVNGASPTKVTWTASVYASLGMVDLINFPTRVTIPVTGYYRVVIFAIITDAGSGGLTDGNISLLQNGAQIEVQIGTTTAGYVGNGPWLRLVTHPIFLTATDYLELNTSALTGAGAHTVKGSVWPTSMSVYLEAANAPGGGDFLANGSIPMTADLDFGGFKGENGADATDPTDFTTLQQVQVADEDLQDQIDAITDGAALAGDQRRYDTGDQGFSTLDWEVVTGLTPMVFTLAVSKFIAIDAHGTALMDFQNRANLQLGIQLQKTGDAVINIPGTQSIDPLGYYVNGSIVAAEKRTLVAGEWTIRLIAKKVFAAPYNPILSKTAAVPAYIGYVLTG